jgi:hypothetical protein
MGVVCSVAGIAGPRAGVEAGEVSTTDPPAYREEKIASTSEVPMKITAAAVVNLLRKFPAPRGPKTV